MWLWIILAVIILIIIYAFILYNNFISLDNKVKEAFSTMDVYLKKRWDLIPNLVETVKGYSGHEKTTLENVIKARNAAITAGSQGNVAGQMLAENQLTGALRQLFALSEGYPDLKANTNFLQLQ